MYPKNKETWEYLCSFSLLRWGETTNIRHAQNSSWQGQEGWNAAFNSWHNSPIYDEFQTQSDMGQLTINQLIFTH